MNYTYVVRCSDGTYYTGWTNDLDKRIRAHNEGKGAKYTRSRGPVELVYYEEFESKEEAMSREVRITGRRIFILYMRRPVILLRGYFFSPPFLRQQLWPHKGGRLRPRRSRWCATGVHAVSIRDRWQ